MADIGLRKILVAVSQPSARGNKAVKRAAQLAHQHGARLELFTCVTSGGVLTGIAGLQAEEWLKALADQYARELERLANRLRREELIVETVVRGASAAHEAILAQARATRADLIVIEAHEHGLVARMLLSQTDFELVRRSPVPLLIVKSGSAWRAPRVLAAVDPFHGNDKPRDLDARILAMARFMAEPMAGAVHLAHVFRPLVEFFPIAVMEPAVVAATPAQNRAYERSIRTQFSRMAGRFGITGRYRHLRAGEPSSELPRIARSLRANLVVMGAVSRSGLRRVFIGNTAERVLDALTCDVLVVKPKGFRAP